MVAVTEDVPRARPGELFELVKPSVLAIAKRLLPQRHRAADRDDLIQVGLIELWHQAENADPSKGPFKPYAEKRVWGAMVDHLRGLKLTHGMTHRTAEIHRRAGKFTPISMTIDIGFTNRSDEKEGYSLHLGRELSCRDPDRGDGDAAELAASIRAIGADIDHTDRDLVVEYYAAGRQMKDIAAARGKSESWASQRLSRGLAAIREAMEARGLRGFA